MPKNATGKTYSEKGVLRPPWPLRSAPTSGVLSAPFFGSRSWGTLCHFRSSWMMAKSTSCPDPFVKQSLYMVAAFSQSMLPLMHARYELSLSNNLAIILTFK
jgi:hypothetical protein